MNDTSARFYCREALRWVVGWPSMCNRRRDTQETQESVRKRQTPRTEEARGAEEGR